MTENDFLIRLQEVLGDSYAIERELGGGGMSHVFLAEETRLGRKVVVKVLPPDMGAGVNAERFEREIQLAARLQHPHIVPLLTAGSEGDLLYYMMPFIEGESLRSKLGREGEQPTDEAIRLLSEVTDALAYAHEAGAVHRDIKPDNVMLSRGHALVADFGVAKAVGASNGDNHSSLTSIGVALGTPAYMSPEQAAADPHVDHRADIYALGAMAYEIFTGRPPFTGNTPQQVLAAHVTQEPDPITMHRDTIPPAVAGVIMKCLAKRPADRWQSAAELRSQWQVVATPNAGGTTPVSTRPVTPWATASTEAAGFAHTPIRIAAIFGAAAAAALVLVYALMIGLGLPDWVFVGAIALLAIGLPIMLATGRHENRRAAAATTGLHTTTPVGLRAHATWRKAFLGGALAFGGLVVLAGGYMATRSLGIGPAATLMTAGVLGERELIILSAFENRTGDSTLGPTVTELLRISLSESPVLRIADPARMTESLARMQLPPDALVSESVAREIAERESIKAVIAGEIVPLGGGYLVSAKVVSATGDVLTAQQASAGDAGELVSAVAELSMKLRERVGESLRTIRRTLPLELVTTGSLRALRLYAQATQAEVSGDNDRAVALLEEAILEDSLFAMAHRKIATVLTNNFEQFGRARDAATRAYELRDRLTELERGYSIGQYHTDVTGRREEALAAYRTLLERYPEDHRALNNSGVLYSQLGDDERAREFYQIALDLDSTWSPGFTNLAFEQKNLGEFDLAGKTLDAMEIRFPDNPSAEDARGNLAVAQEDYDGAARHWTNVLEAQSGNLAWRAGTSERLAFLLATQGRYREGEGHQDEALAALRQRGVPTQRLATWWGFARLMALPEHGPSEQLLGGITPEAMDSMAVPDRQYESIIQYFALSGDAARASEFLQKMEQSGYPELGRDSRRDFDRSRGWAAIAAGDTDRGLDHMRAGIDGFACKPCGLGAMAIAHDAASNPDSALAYWEEYLDTYWGLPSIEAWARPLAFRRLGEIYESHGERDKAVEHYDRFVELWKNADAELQPQVTDTRERIARLIGEANR
jgi:tetratricopeptide (TPR) repeat protein